jgi:hypothetical protein
LFKKYILDNPEIIRHLRTSFRYPRFLSFVIIFQLSLLSIYALIYFTMSLGSSRADFKFENYCKVIYVTTMAIEYIFYFYVGTYLISNSLAQEKEKGTFDFIRLTIIEKKVIAVGKLLGAPIFLTFLLAITFPFVVASAIFAGIEPLHFLIVHFNLLIYSLLFHTLGLFCAVSMPRLSSANATALSMPLLITTTTLILSGRSSNPFYNLFSSLGSTIFQIYDIKFFGFPVPDFLLIGSVIFYMVIWFVIGLTRKLESETNHSLSKKQAVWFTAGIEFIIIGTLWHKLIEGSPTAITQYFILNIALLLILTAILNTTREDILIFLNKPKQLYQLWDSKSPVFSVIVLLNIVIFGFIMVPAITGMVINQVPVNIIYMMLFYSLLLFLFSFVYSQIFFLTSIAFIKNAGSLTSLIIALTLFIPIPLNYLTKNREDFFDLFIFNPFVAFARLTTNDFFNLANISQVMLLVIALLTLNVIVLSKQEKINRKYRL